MKKISISMIVVGAGLAAFGFSGFDASFRTIMGAMDGGAGWDTASRIEITIGVALFTFGIFLYKELR